MIYDSFFLGGGGAFKSYATFLLGNMFSYTNHLNVCHWLKQKKTKLLIICGVIPEGLKGTDLYNHTNVSPPHPTNVNTINRGERNKWGYLIQNGFKKISIWNIQLRNAFPYNVLMSQDDAPLCCALV